MGRPETHDCGELEFFGVKLKVNNPRLAALLNSDVTDDVQVVGWRAREVIAGSGESRAERDVAERVRNDDEPAVLRVDDFQEG